MNIIFGNAQPIYQQIISRVLLSIAKGELQPGGKIAPVREMAAKFKVNPNTMQKSLAKLEEMGYLYTEGTAGRFVTKDTEIIKKLRTSLPMEITTRFINEMLECGVPRMVIPGYVGNLIQKRN